MRMLSAKQRTTTKWFAIGVILSAAALAATTPLLWAQVNLQGRWTTLPYLMPINPIHLALLNTGKVLIVAGSGNVATEKNYQAAVWRSEEHTSELQSRLHLVCRLLLEKKKKKKTKRHKYKKETK